MRNAFVLMSVIFLFSCAVNVPFQITKSPEGTTDQQRLQDDQECREYSKESPRRLGGLGPLVAKSVASERYKECMTARGYTVELVEQETPGVDLNDSSSDPNSRY
jgi:hypothetical protein